MARLLAEFQMEHGRPAYIEQAERRHYRIRLFLRDAPADAITVTYQLDETYPEPIRVVPAGVTESSEFITSYGDYDIRVFVRTKADMPQFLLTERLSNALRANYKGVPDPAVNDAIRQIAAN